MSAISGYQFTVHLCAGYLVIIQYHLNFFHMFVCSQNCNIHHKYQKSREGAELLPYKCYIGMSCRVGYGLSEHFRP